MKMAKSKRSKGQLTSCAFTLDQLIENENMHNCNILYF